MNRITLVHLSALNAIFHSPQRLVLCNVLDSSMLSPFESYLKMMEPSSAWQCQVISGRGNKLQSGRFRLDIWKMVWGLVKSDQVKVSLI